MLAFVVTAIPSLTAPDCIKSFVDANLKLRDFDLFDTWFDDNSTFTLAQTSTFAGVDVIEEYMKFVLPFSPYVSTSGLLRSDASFVSFDEEKRSCVFKRMNHNRYQMSEMANNELFETAIIFQLEWRFDDQKVGDIQLYCAPPLGAVILRACADSALLAATVAPDMLDRLFSAFDTPAADNFVCQTMRDSCPDVWAANDLTSIGECEAKLAALPLAEGEEFYIDGNTCLHRPQHRPNTQHLSRSTSTDS